MDLPIPYWIGLLFTPRENKTAYSLLFTHNNADFGAIHSVTERSYTTPISKVKRHISSCEQVFGPLLKSIGTVRNYDSDGKENVKKAIGLLSKTATLHVHHAFLYISSLSLHNYDVKLNDQILSLLENGNGEAMTSSTISV